MHAGFIRETLHRLSRGAAKRSYRSVIQINQFASDRKFIPESQMQRFCRLRYIAGHFLVTHFFEHTLTFMNLTLLFGHAPHTMWRI